MTYSHAVKTRHNEAMIAKKRELHGNVHLLVIDSVIQRKTELHLLFTLNNFLCTSVEIIQ